MLKIYDYQNQNELMKLLRDRAENIPDHVMNAVSGVLNSVRNEGDKAVREWSQKFDGVAPDNFYMTKEEITVREILYITRSGETTVYLKSDSGIFSIPFEESILFLEEGQKVTVAYAYKSESGVTPISRIE